MRHTHRPPHAANQSCFARARIPAASSTSPDNTAAFQSALNAAGDAGGGVVWVPAGNFTFQGSLSIPTATALVGTYQAVMAHAVGQNGRFPGQGSVLMPRAGRGNDSATPFVTMADNSQVKGFVFYYPDQVPDAAPVPYPWTINMVRSEAGATRQRRPQKTRAWYAVAVRPNACFCHLSGLA